MRALALAGLLAATVHATPLSQAERSQICESHIRESQKSVCLQLIALDESLPLAKRREQQSCVFGDHDAEQCLTASQRNKLAALVAQRRLDCAGFSDEALRCLQKNSAGCQPILDSLTFWREPIPSAPPGPAVLRTFTLPAVSQIDRLDRRFELTSDGTLTVIDPHARASFRKGKRVARGSGSSYHFALPDVKVGSDQFPIAAPGAVIYNDDDGILRATHLIRSDRTRWKIKTGCAGLPAADEKLVYTISFGLDERGPLRVIALDQADGHPVWQTELAREAPTLEWRDDARVLVAPGHLLAIVKSQVYELR